MLLSRYIPGWIAILLAYLIGFLHVVLLVIALPFILIYYFALCIGAWFVLPKLGKDVLIVSNGSVDSGPWLAQVIPMVKDRALFLNYEERESWQRWSLPVQLFHAFGPSAKPAFHLPYFIPAVLLMRKFRLPTQYNFGERSVNREANLERLRSALGSVPD